ncbi:hypothetical protein [Mycobacterium sp. shizuoka-1]|uniref:hypothetical protein n=1 Tax=Mycobacterium sp. shizuoka-1 TaxID=2039281 RepID=UPI000C062042|nr:hypothetical protein [Mycobacterium sp. shizuoka-1]GAY16181.1 hypothetical protein MSZK_29070 [Mycobacterium sp. shizuoka-1]
MSDEFDGEIADLAHTPEQLERLFRDRPKYWELAGFASELVWRKQKLQTAVEAHRHGLGSASRRSVETSDDLLVLYHGVLSRLLELQEELERAMVAPSFRRLFGDQDLYDAEPTPQDVTAAATVVIDFYRNNLILARDTRGVEAPDGYRAVIDDMARLVDASLDGVDRFVSQLVGFVAVIPSLGWRESDATEFHTLALTVDCDDALMDSIARQLKTLRRPSWRSWLSRPRG